MALSLSDNSQFFGLDLSQWPRKWRGAAELLLDMPGLRPLTAPVPVQLLDADGGFSDWQWRLGVIAPQQGGSPANTAHAVALSADAVLERTLTLPRLNQADVAQAVALEAASISPFGAAQTVAGFSVEPPAKGAQTQTVHMALTSRKQLEQAVQRAQASFAERGAGIGENDIEVWVLPSRRQETGGEAGVLPQTLRPVVFDTAGVQPRQALVARGRASRVGLVALTAVLLAALAATPVWQARGRAIQAQAALDQVSRDVAPQQAQREALVKQADALRAVGGVLKTQLAPMPVLNLVTRVLPDTAWINTLRVEGDKVILTGNADDAAALVQALSKEEGVKEVRLPSPATRPAGAAKENFNIELRLDPERFGLAKPKGAAA